ncbi:chromatin structure-remodeling complex subunit RSC7 [Coemansia sp. RSA 1358]|nr:chromatin structure-remodeling complex subunit RSC7 [Coemansia umbellata]KAJ2620201.1 chromatin structure-remodeling complex subunit RSC7 [Coemansia sp. RSA 1358]
MRRMQQKEDWSRTPSPLSSLSASDLDANPAEEVDPEGETKIDRNGYLQGGREFICPVFRSPFRTTKDQYVLTMDCCRFMGARDSYMLFKQHPKMSRIETTQEERDLLAERRMIPKVTRLRPIALITARTAFREFGARIVKNGRYITDDYWVARARREARYPEGTLVANMSVYETVMAAHAAGVTPGSTRKARKTKPLSPKPQRGLTMATALLKQDTLPVIHLGPDTILPRATGTSQPVFHKLRSADTAEAAFPVLPVHRAQFADSSYIDSTLVHSVSSWPRSADSKGGAMRMAREFNTAVRMWRDDNGGTWMDPHTGVRQLPGDLQPTKVWVTKEHGNSMMVDPKIAFGQKEECEAEEFPLALLPGQFQQSFPVHRTRFNQSLEQAARSYSSLWSQQLALQQPLLKK